jgi:hypothetical protein
MTIQQSTRKKPLRGSGEIMYRDRSKPILSLARIASLALFVLVFALAPALVHAQTATLFGALSNFDVMNDTGQETHGFEIELDGVTSQDLLYTFTGNRYGVATVVPFRGGVYIRYQSAWDANAQQFVRTTPIATVFTPTNGHQCTQGSFGYATSGCEHFGVGTLVNPTATIYRWLLADPQNLGSLTPAGTAVSIAAPVWTVVPPVQVGAAPVVVAEIQAPPPPRPEAQYGEAQWVKVFKTELPREVGLDELMSDNPVVPQDPAQAETAWKLMQTNPNKRQRGRQANQGELGNGSHSVIRRYEFYKYSGVYDPLTHEALCGGDATCNAPLDGELGDYVGAQMAAANLEVPSITVTRIGNGSVTTADRLINCGKTCFANVNAGQVITLTASPSSGSVFTGWSGACNNSAGSCTVTVDRAATVTANFASAVKISVSHSGPGTVAAASVGIDCGRNCSASVASGTTVTFTAQPDPGLRFGNWTGACSGTNPTCTITITSNVQVQAVYLK